MTNEDQNEAAAILTGNYAGVVKHPGDREYMAIHVFVGSMRWDPGNETEGMPGAWLQRTDMEVAEAAAEVAHYLSEQFPQGEPAPHQRAQQQPPQNRPQQGQGGGRPQQPRRQGGGRPARNEPAPGWFCDTCHEPGERKKATGAMPGDAIQCSGTCKNDQGYPALIAWVTPGTDDELPRGGNR